MRFDSIIPASWVLATLLSPAWSQSPASPALLTPEEAVRLGLEGNPALSIARDDAAVAAYNRQGGIGPFLPELGASANHGGTFGEDDARTTVGVSAGLLIFDGFQSYHGYKRLKAREEGARLQERLAVESTVEDVLTAYYGIALQKRRLESIRELLAVSAERAKLAQARMEVGAGSRLEQLQALSDLNADSASWLAQEATLREAKVGLNALLGRGPGIDFDVLDTIPLDADLPADALRKELAEGNTALRAARLDRSAARSGLKEAQAGYWPDLNASLRYSTAPEALNDPATPGVGNGDGVTYGLSLSVPLFDRLRTRTGVGNARLGLRQAETRIRQRETEVEGEFERALARHASGLRRVALEEGNLEVASLQAEAARERYRLGASSPLEFRDAQTRLLDSKTRLASARQETKAAELALKRLSGRLVKDTQ